MDKLLSRLCEHEKAVAYCSEAAENETWFDIRTGDHPVLVSAPHACIHHRDGQPKPQEEFTAAFVLALAEDTGCSAIYVKNKTREDPNWQPRGEYKQAVCELVDDRGIRLLVDLHGMTNRHRMGVALGTMNGTSCTGHDVVGPFVAEGFELFPIDKLDESGDTCWRRLTVDHPRFTGGVRNSTVTRFAVRQLRIKALQVELSSACRVVYSEATADWPVEYTGEHSGIDGAYRALRNIVDQVMANEY